MDVLSLVISPVSLSSLHIWEALGCVLELHPYSIYFISLASVYTISGGEDGMGRPVMAFIHIIIEVRVAIVHSGIMIHTSLDGFFCLRH